MEERDTARFERCDCVVIRQIEDDKHREIAVQVLDHTRRTDEQELFLQSAGYSPVGQVASGLDGDPGSNE